MTPELHSGDSDVPTIPGSEGLTQKPLAPWLIRMGDHKFRVMAENYEAAVVWLEAWCIDQGIERKGAEFTREAVDA